MKNIHASLCSGEVSRDDFRYIKIRYGQVYGSRYSAISPM